MKTGLRHPHLASNVKKPDGDPRYPLRERYRQTNYTVEGREEAKRAEDAKAEEYEPPMPAPVEPPPDLAPERDSDADVGVTFGPPLTEAVVIPHGAFLEGGSAMET